MRLAKTGTTTLLWAVALLLTVSRAQAAETTYGEGVKLAETTSMEKILADPDAFVGKRVRIEGKVVDVCPMKGCWMELEEAKAGNSLKIKVDDGVMVFPVTAKGKVAVAEGVVEAIPMDREQYVAWLQHLAEERGEAFDDTKVGAGPFRLLQLRGSGARIAD